MRPAILPRPEKSADDQGVRVSEMWLDEAIWGHRLHDEQTPELVFLEFLNVLNSEHDNNRAFREEGGVNTLRYRPHHYLYLRNILFNSPRLLAFLKDSPDDATRWREWIAYMGKKAGGLPDDADFSYIAGRFASFEDFVSIVQLLRTTAIEGRSNKRWSSKFVFPYGPAALYEDLNVKPSSVTNDRRFFGRTGELVYLMLCRSGRTDELLAQLRPLLLDENSRWNRLIRAFTTGEPSDLPVRPNAYLPYATLPGFTEFADDWLALLSCRMPGYDVVPHLVDILGLHVVLYKLRCAHFWAAPDVPVQMVLEIMAPRRTTVRDLSTDTYEVNKLRSREAIEAYVKENVDQTPEWQSAIQSPDAFNEACQVLRRKVRWPDLELKDYSAPENPVSLRATLWAAALKRHTQHVGNVHGHYAGSIGLATRRGTRQIRYAPNDQILRSLVFAIVPRRMEFQQFLQIIYERYGLIVGHRQATTFIGLGQSDQKSFEDNARRLEMRLGSLGLLRRLSDACAYVENPYARDR